LNRVKFNGGHPIWATEISAGEKRSDYEFMSRETRAIQAKGCIVKNQQNSWLVK